MKIHLLFWFAALIGFYGISYADDTGTSAGGDGKDEFVLHMEYLGQTGPSTNIQQGWNIAEVCCINLNDDFTEYPSFPMFDNKALDVSRHWNDCGTPPPGATHYPNGVVLDQRRKRMGGRGYPIDRWLEARKSDDRLVSVRVWLESDHIPGAFFYFDPDKYNIVIYKFGNKEKLTNEDLGPVKELSNNNAVYLTATKTGEPPIYKEYLFEGIEPGQTKPNEDPSNYTLVRGKIVLPPGTDPAPGMKTVEVLKVAVEKTDFVIEPKNYTSNNQQIYINEFVEEGEWGGAWLRLNNDFSKRQEDVEADEPEYFQDNVLVGDEWEMDPRSEDMIKSRVRALGLYSEIVELIVPEDVVVWEVFETAVTNDDGILESMKSYHDETVPIPIERANTSQFFIEGVLESSGLGQSRVKLTYRPQDFGWQSGAGGVNMFEAGNDQGALVDESAYTIQRLDLLVDGNRNGDLEDSEIRDRHLLFWWNSDVEIRDDGLSTSGDVYSDFTTRADPTRAQPRVDSLDRLIHNRRDMEDLAALKLQMGDTLVEAHLPTGDAYKPNLMYKKFESHILDFSNRDWADPQFYNFHMFEWNPEGAVTIEAKQHIEDQTSMDAFVHDTSDLEAFFPKRILPDLRPFDDMKSSVPITDWEKAGKTTVYNPQPKKNFLFEAAQSPDTTTLDWFETDLVAKTLIKYQTNSEYEISVPVSLRIGKIEKFYDQFAVPEEINTKPDVVFFSKSQQTGWADCHSFNSLPPAMGHENNEFFKLPEEQYLIYVHGWNNTADEKAAAIQTIYKRMYWQGYQGRVGIFSWPCLYENSLGELTFNPSEFNAWRSGMSLLVRMYDLATKYNGKLHLFAHSQGNVPAAEAQRLWFRGNAKSPLMKNPGKFWNRKMGLYRGQSDEICENYFAVNAAHTAGLYGADHFVEDQHGNKKLANYFDNNTIVKAIDLIMNLSDDNLKQLADDYSLTAVGKNAIYQVLSNLRNRWFRMGVGIDPVDGKNDTGIRNYSDYYRFFAAGVNKDSWERLFFVPENFYDGNVPYMEGAYGSAGTRYNYYCNDDFAVGFAWESQLAIKGLLATSPSWKEFTYSSELDARGQWKFSRNMKTDVGRIFDTIIGSVLGGLGDSGTDLGFDFLVLILKQMKEEFFHGTFTEDFLNMYIETNGVPLLLGKSIEMERGDGTVGPVADPARNAYEVLAFLSRASNQGMGKISIGHKVPAKWKWKDVDQDEEFGNNKEAPGGYGSPSHSYFYYHDCWRNAKFYKRMVEDIGKGEDGIGSTYPNNNPDN